jgi:hypothetical protein
MALIKDKSQIKSLVNQLESHLKTSDNSIKSQFRIDPSLSDINLDDLFLAPDFNKSFLIPSNFHILRPPTQMELE